MQHVGTTVDNRASAAISCTNVDERAIELLSIQNTWHQTGPGFVRCVCIGSRTSYTTDWKERRSLCLRYCSAVVTHRHGKIGCSGPLDLPDLAMEDLLGDHQPLLEASAAGGGSSRGLRMSESVGMKT